MAYGTSYKKKFNHPNPATYNSVRHQSFSLPPDVISHISKNPISADGLSKLQKSCKYFFAKNKIIICNKSVSQQWNNCWFFNLNFEEFIYFKNYKSIKFWLTGKLSLTEKLVLPNNIYRGTLQNLIIKNQNLTFDEINFLMDGMKIEKLSLNYVNIHDKNGNLVSCDRILAKVPNILEFSYFCQNEIFTTKTFEKMNALQFKSKFNHFELAIFNLSPDAELALLSDFISKNAYEFSEFYFLIKTNNPELHLETLQSAVEEMLQNWETQKKPTVWFT